jgi:hypothetical protein
MKTLRQELKRKLLKLLTAALPYICVLSAGCQNVLQIINMSMSYTLKDDAFLFVNNTSPYIYDKIKDGETVGNMGIAMASIASVCAITMAIHSDQLKKISKKLSNDNTNLTEQVAGLSMWRRSVIGHEPFDDEAQPSPIDSDRTAYPAGVHIPDENGESGEV